MDETLRGGATWGTGNSDNTGAGGPEDRQGTERGREDTDGED